MNKKNVILGIGTGRCGTVSLSELFNKQKSSCFSHELKIKLKKPTDYNTPLSWKFDGDAFNLAWQSILNYDAVYVGDVSMFWLPYLEHVLKIDNSVKIICLQREKSQVVKSYMSKTPGRNHWIDHDGTKWKKCPWDKSYPKFSLQDKEQALNKYWDYYYRLSNKLIKTHPNNIRLFQTTDLNNNAKVAEILDFAGFSNQNIISNIQRNKIEKNLFDKIKRKILGA